jgi:Uma2 family endonuclease
MALKLKEYFLAGVRLVWFVDPRKRTVRVFTGPDRSTVLTEQDTLDGSDVLPGLALPIKEVFAKLSPAGTGTAKPTKPRAKGRNKDSSS